METTTRGIAEAFSPRKVAGGSLVTSFKRYCHTHRIFTFSLLQKWLVRNRATTGPFLMTSFIQTNLEKNKCLPAPAFWWKDQNLKIKIKIKFIFYFLFSHLSSTSLFSWLMFKKKVKKLQWAEMAFFFSFFFNPWKGHTTQVNTTEQ